MPPHITSRRPTQKGARTASRILDAATTVLSRDGFGGATVGRIAQEVGIDKRGVLYHFGTRQELLVRVVQIVGERIAANAAAQAGDRAPEGRTSEAIIDALWAGITSEPQPVRAYFALVGGGAESAEVIGALRELKATYVRLIAHQLAGAHAPNAGRSDAESHALVLFALLRGLALEWIETGDGLAITAGVGELKALAAR